MGAATCQAQIGTGASASWANAETGAKFNEEDSLAGTTPVPIPTATGTTFSWLKNLVLAVTVAGTTTISNRKVYLASSPATGLNVYWKALAVGSYAEASSGNEPPASGSNGVVPSGYTLMTTTPTVYDSTAVSSGSTGPNGMMVVCVLGVDHTFAGGPGSAISVPSIKIDYDEQ